MFRPIAIHLPQFHPFAENDAWWGKGFTEWTNVTKAKPLFKDHYQPHLPADLGFYDLRLEESRLAQEALAKAYGIYGFCYYHYWFNGKRLLHEPVDRKLKNPKEDLPFMLCWANENWTRRWDGHDNEILIKQEYSETDDLEHIKFLCEHFFRDNRYIKIDGKPFIAIYKTYLIPNIEEMVDIWRRVAKSYGFEGIYICFMDNFIKDKSIEPKIFDAGIEFHPDFRRFPKRELGGYYSRILNKFKIKSSYFYENLILDYQKYIKNVEKFRLENISEYKLFPGITPSWDNRARRNKGATIFINSKTLFYELWLKHIKSSFKPMNKEENFIFINAWNEWAEGNHLEPCTKMGNEYLKITKKILKS